MQHSTSAALLMSATALVCTLLNTFGPAIRFFYASKAERSEAGFATGRQATHLSPDGGVRNYGHQLINAEVEPSSKELQNPHFGSAEAVVKMTPEEEKEQMMSTIRRLLRDNTNGNISEYMHGAKGQPLVIDRLLGGKRDGFFVEAGAADGLKISNTLFFEINRNWTGLLVEANPNYYSKLCQTNRRAVSINCCLGSRDTRERVDFVFSGLRGSIIGSHTLSRGVSGNVTTLDCLPLLAILEAINRTKIDLLSLDMEGAEFPVLKLMPFDKLDVGIVLVELLNLDSIVHVDLKDFFKLMDNSGFEFLGTVAKDAVFGNRKWELQVPKSVGASTTPVDAIQKELSLPVRGYMRHRIEMTLKRLRQKKALTQTDA